jgi:hypothetical protein
MQLSVKFQENKHEFIEKMLRIIDESITSCKNAKIKRLLHMKYFIYSGCLYLSIS